MQAYFATFVSGVQDIIASRLAQYPNATLAVKDITDGLVVFESNLTINQLAELRFFHNVYQLLADYSAMPSNSDLVAKARGALRAGSTFIVRVREGSQPVSPDAELVAQLSSATQSIHVAHKPQIQLALLKRTNGHIFWGVALERTGFKTRKLEPGELRPELAHVLGLVANVDSKDTVLDPFAGYGAIPREMLQGFHCQKVIAVEHNESLIPHLKSIPNLVALHGNAGELAHIESRSIDRVVTDPPWGDFNGMTIDELQHLYKGAIIQMHRVLRAKGCAVILTAAEFLPEQALELGFTIEKQYFILVSGRKAGIYKIRKL